MKPSYHPDLEFQALLEGREPTSLERLALELARDAEPSLRIEDYLARIDELARRVRARIVTSATPLEILRQVSWLFDQEESYRGNKEDYGDPRNSLLNEVMDRRLGIPITLAVLYRAIAARLGVGLAGVGLPAHFVLRTLPPEPEFFIDAFDGGRLLDRAGCQRLVSQRLGRPVTLDANAFKALLTRAIVERMLRNLRESCRLADEPTLLVATLERLHALATSDPTVPVELASLLRSLDRPGRALEVIDEAMRRETGQHSDLPTIRARIARDLADRN